MGLDCNYKAENNYFDPIKTLITLESKGLCSISNFCPEQSEFPTPREPMNIHFGDGFDVLEGGSQVITHSGVEVSTALIKAAQNTLSFCKQNKVTHAVLMEGSPSCGAQWVYKGECWPKRVKKEGMGVAAALLKKHNISVVSHLNLAVFVKEIAEQSKI